MRVEERRIVELQDGQIDAGRDGHDRCRYLVAGRVGLNLHLAGVENHVGIGQDALALDHHAGGGHLARRLLGPGLERIGIAHGREDLDHRILDGRRPAASAARAAARGAPATLKPQIKQMQSSASRLKSVMGAVRVLFSVDREGEQGVAAN